MLTQPGENHEAQAKKIDLSGSVRWPYPRGVYIRRVVWRLVYASVWKLCWKRIYWARVGLLRMLGAKGKGLAQIAGSAWVEMPWQLQIGHRVAIGDRAILYNLGPMVIGDDTIISQDAYLCGGTHDYTQASFPLLRMPVTIGRGVWIAAGAFIGPGVTVGDGAIVGARAVVTRDVEPWTVVAGNPARVIRKREMVDDAAGGQDG